MKLLQRFLLSCTLMLCLSVAGHAQSAPVLWSNNWNVNFFFPQQATFSSDSKYFAMGYDKGDVVIFEAATGEVYRTYHLHTRHVFCTVFQPNGHLLVSGDKEGFMVIYDYETGKEIRTIKAHDQAITAITFSRDGSILVTGSNDNAIKIWEPTTSKELKTIYDVKGNIRALRLSNDNATIIAGTATIYNALRFFDIKTGAETQTLPSDNLQHLDLSPDGQLIATANLEKFVMLFDLKRYKSVAHLAGHTRNLTDVAFNNTGSILYSSGNDKKVIAWDMVHQRPIVSIFSSERKISSISCSPDGKYLAVMDEKGIFSILDVSLLEAAARKDIASDHPDLR